MSTLQSDLKNFSMFAFLSLFLSLSLSLSPSPSFLSEVHKAPSDLVDLLVQKNLYDMAFTVLLRFFKGSALKRCG